MCHNYDHICKIGFYAAIKLVDDYRLIILIQLKTIFYRYYEKYFIVWFDKWVFKK